jgi:hypothetical protein
VRRGDLDRFLFAADDVIIAVSQDGLVTNVEISRWPAGARRQSRSPASTTAFSCRWRRRAWPEAISAARDVVLQHRTMVAAQLDDGQHLLGLNEIFVGHRSHQSARYDIEVGGKQEFQSSSGLIVSSGTGATGWARSLMESMHVPLALKPDEDALAYFVREAFPSVSTGTSIRAGKIDKLSPIHVTSRMNDGGVIFADGIEQDHLNFDWGRMIEVSVAARRLNLVMPPTS